VQLLAQPRNRLGIRPLADHLLNGIAGSYIKQQENHY